MDTLLSTPEIRVLGCLLEKEATTPDYYPMTLNGLVTACNQKSNRDPVVDYDERDVAMALEDLREKRLVLRVDQAGGRVPKYRHAIQNLAEIEKPAQAVLTVLMLRGAQTLGAIRQRTERHYAFPDLAATEAAMAELIDPEVGLAVALPRAPGSREVRHMHLLAGPVDMEVPEGAPPPTEAVMQTVQAERMERAEVDGKIAELEAEVAELRESVASLKTELAEVSDSFATFREQFE